MFLYLLLGQKKHMVREGPDVNKEKHEVNPDIGGVKPGVRLNSLGRGLGVLLVFGEEK